MVRLIAKVFHVPHELFRIRENQFLSTQTFTYCQYFRLDGRGMDAAFPTQPSARRP